MGKKVDLAWPLFLKVAFLHKHATLLFAHVSPAHSSPAGLVSDWCEKAPVRSSQLWTLEAPKITVEKLRL